MIRFLKGLLGGGDAQSDPEAASTRYNGYTIIPRSRDTGSGWTTEGLIRKEFEGETREHVFIRADSSTSRDAAETLVVSKARVLIDQQGDRIFPDSDQESARQN